ncbi:MAG: vitamin B12 dependent-methionine synthase activation domain-containing protein, partial [Myxococcota bacterium]
GVIGLFPANSDGDDIALYCDDARSKPLAVVHGLRQQMEKRADQPSLALADFIAPKSSGLADHLGAFAVTAGVGIDEHVARFEAQHDDYNAILLKSLADRLAEAFAERMHEKVRTELWGYARGERLDNDALIREEYQGIRPAPGYPACPDHSTKPLLFSLLEVERHIGVTLTENFAMVPTAAVSGWYLGHKAARYFGLGRVGRDQVEDYARRRGISMEQAERWLAPNLGY